MTPTDRGIPSVGSASRDGQWLRQSRRVRRFTTYAAALALATSATIVGVAGEASATDHYKCKESGTTLWPKGTGGFGRVDVFANLCIYHEYGKVFATEWVRWKRYGTPMGDGFDKLTVTVRLEDADVPVTHRTCDITNTINTHADSGTDWACHLYTIEISDASKTNWSADGSLTRDYNNDGEGSRTFQLAGSPRM